MDDILLKATYQGTMKYLMSITGVLFLSIVSAQSIEGQWKTIDDESGKARSVVEIYKKGDKFYGKVVELFLEPGEDTDPVCSECDEEDSRFMQKVRGMEIIQRMEYDSNDQRYEDGTILDPENGNVYDLSLIHI